MIKAIKYLLISLLLIQCKKNIEKYPLKQEVSKVTFSKKQPIENLKDEKVIVSLNFNNRNDAYFIIRNQLKYDIIINKYLLGSSLIALDQDIDG